MVRRLLIIANPIAGGGKAKRRAVELQEALRPHGIEAECYFTSAAGDARSRAAGLGEDRPPWDAVAVVGGDGTVNEVLNGLPDPSLPMAVLEEAAQGGTRCTE